MSEQGDAVKAIDVIHEEHRIILDFIDKVQISLELLAKGEHPPKRFFELAVQFTQDYIERFHHFKEELVLFVKLAERMGGKIDAHIDSLREQHNRSHNFISEVIQSLEGYERGDRGLTNKLFCSFGYYTSLERAHLNRENHVFIPLISREFSDAEQETFVEIFRKEEQNLGKGYKNSCMALLDEMTDLLEFNYLKRYKYMLDSVSSKRVRPAAA